MLAVDADETLLARCHTRDLNALEELYDRHHRYVYAAAFKLTGDVGLAECAVETAFGGLWRTGSRPKPAHLPVRDWLLRVALLHCLRDRSRRAALAVPHGYDQVVHELPVS